MSDLRVQFIHGLEGSPQGSKARYLAEHFEAITPAMDTSSFKGCIATQAEAIEEFKPDVLVASSFGGAVAVALLDQGLWKGPTLLLAQAALMFPTSGKLPADVTVWLVHGVGDLVVDVEDSQRLAATGSPDRVRLIEVDDDHRLSKSVEAGLLAEWVRGIVEADRSMA